MAPRTCHLLDPRDRKDSVTHLVFGTEREGPRGEVQKERILRVVSVTRVPRTDLTSATLRNRSKTG